MIRDTVYKLKGQNVIITDKNFIKKKFKAKDEDFETEEYTLIIPVSKIDEWAIKLENTRKALKGGAE